MTLKELEAVVLESEVEVEDASDIIEECAALAAADAE
jgi:hypothetical protein